MAKNKRLPRRWCPSCRKQFRPHPSASHNQKTCSAACRLKRKRALARRRREQALAKHRLQERQRRQKLRRRRRQSSLSAEKRTRSVSASRATLPAEVSALQELILETWDKQVGRSRASLLVELRAKLQEIGTKLLQADSNMSSGHAPAPKR